MKQLIKPFPLFLQNISTPCGRFPNYLYLYGRYLQATCAYDDGLSMSIKIKESKENETYPRSLRRSAA
ncbi:MAG: hypothetical protein HUJ99_03285 [Bacteroidaceae bacterium]|nr:hypothetical protein [Bacteroidaceae bacterium]